MPRLLLSLAALIFLPHLSLAVLPVKVPPNGKAQGFLGNLGNTYPPPTGDWLTSTLCYCHSPIKMKETWQYEKAHIFQHEYYNYHSNATFVADHMCLSRARTEGDKCNRPNVQGDNNDWILENPYVCKKFPRSTDETLRQIYSKRSTRRPKRNAPHTNKPALCTHDCDMGPFTPDPDELARHPKQDKVCFGVDTNFYGMDEMWIKFNRQKRVMKKKSQQGRTKTKFAEVQGYCEDMCQSTFGMPADMEINDKRADGGSRQYVYTELDDMCDNCK